jgi:hypothetical protein
VLVVYGTELVTIEEVLETGYVEAGVVVGVLITTELGLVVYGAEVVVLASDVVGTE